MKKIRNWDGSRIWEPGEIHYPQSAEEIAGLLRRALEDRQRVKALGSAPPPGRTSPIRRISPFVSTGWPKCWKWTATNLGSDSRPAPA